MRNKVTIGIMFVSLLISTLTFSFGIQTVKADETETYHYSFSRFLKWIGSVDNAPPDPLNPVPFICSFNMAFGPSDAYGVRNITIPKESFYFEPFSFVIYIFNQPFLITVDIELTENGYGRLYTVDGTGDVDIISMANDTGTFFKKDGEWHPAGEEWIGDGTPDPANSSWFYVDGNLTWYLNGSYLAQDIVPGWYTTGYSETTIIEPNCPMLNGYHMNATGVPFANVNGTVTYVTTSATLNRTRDWGTEDTISTAEIAGGATPVSQGSLFSPADLYITDPLDRSIGTPSNGTPVISTIPEAFYTGPNSEPERIIIPNPINGTYSILITGTDNGNFTFMVDFAFSTNLSERTKDVYYGSVADKGVLWSKVIVSGSQVTSFTPVSTIGDINQDATVDIVDIVHCALSYGSEPEDNPETPWDETEDWNPLTDLDLNEIIDIVDLVKIAIHFGETV